MSGIHGLGQYNLKRAIERFDNERYEGCNGCSHVMDENGTWLLDEKIEQKVVAYNERDSFGPGEVYLSCLACDEAQKTEYDCDFCGHVGPDVSGLTDHETHEEYMACVLCRDIDYTTIQIDSLRDELSYPQESGNPRDPAQIRREIDEEKVKFKSLCERRDHRKLKEKK